MSFAVLAELVSEAATKCVSQKKAFLEIAQNSQESTCARVSFLIKLQASGRTPLVAAPINKFS